MIERGTRIWVVGFVPAGDSGGVGGFDWMPTKDEAVKLLIEQLAHDRDGQNVLTFRAVVLPSHFEDRAAVTAWLDSEGVELWEPARAS